MKSHNIAIGFMFTVFVGLSVVLAQSDSPKLKELYFGEEPPGKRAEIFAPEVLAFEPHDSPIISKDETWMIVGTMEHGIKFYKMVDGKLSLTTNPLGFDIPEICNGIALSPAKDRVYFLIWKNDDEDFYFIEKTENHWTPPKSLGEEINSFRTHWQFSLAMNENLYFASDSILVSVFDGNSHLRPVALKLEDSSPLRGSTPFIAPDESYLIFSMDEDLHISYNLYDGKWTAPRNLGPDINSDNLENCPVISPNGKYLFFISRRDSVNLTIYWADAGFIEKSRPPELPKKE
jgi:Tol biopolymer transport system component